MTLEQRRKLTSLSLPSVICVFANLQISSTLIVLPSMRKSWHTVIKAMEERPAKRQRVDYSNTGTEDTNSYRRAVIDVLVTHYDRIRSELKGTMESFASKMYSKGFISSHFMDFASIFEQFKAGFELCGSILEIQQRYKCFTDILLDLGRPVGVVGKEIEEILSNLTGK